MNFKRFGAFGLAAGLSLALLPSAHADSSYYLWPLNEEGAISLPAGAPLRLVNAGASFLDTYHFKLSQTSDVFGGVASAISSYQGLTIKGLAFDSISLAPESGTLGSLQTSSNVPQFSFANLVAGNYVLTLSGRAIGSQGGSYYGNLFAVASNVPEPAGLVLTLSGLMLVGAIARRKQA